MASLEQRLMNEQLRRPRGQVSSVELRLFAKDEIELLDFEGYDNDWDYSWGDEWELAGRGHNRARMFALGEPEGLLLPYKGKWPPLLVSFSLSDGNGWVGLFSSRVLPSVITQVFGPIHVVNGEPQVSVTSVNVARRLLVDSVAARAVDLQEKSVPQNTLDWSGLWQEIPEQKRWPFDCLWMPIRTRSVKAQQGSDWIHWEAAVRQAATEQLGAPAYWSSLNPQARPQSYPMNPLQEIPFLLQELWGAQRAAKKEREAIREAMRASGTARSAAQEPRRTPVPSATQPEQPERAAQQNLVVVPVRARRSNRL